jgi:suppressor for copper-sensitivity B
MVAMVLLIRLWKLQTNTSKRRRIYATSIILIILTVCTLPITVSQSKTTIMVSHSENHAWRPFDRDAIMTSVRNGETVFVDVTADWCLTCQANKFLVIDCDPVATALKGPRITLMRADWTRPDDRIASFLVAYGRYGVPFNIIFGPGAPEGISLPELLDAKTVLAALHSAMLSNTQPESGTIPLIVGFEPG